MFWPPTFVFELLNFILDCFLYHFMNVFILLLFYHDLCLLLEPKLHKSLRHSIDPLLFKLLLLLLDNGRLHLKLLNISHQSFGYWLRLDPLFSILLNPG